MIDTQVAIAILALAGTIIAGQSALIVAILRRRNNNKKNSNSNKKNNPNHIMEHLKTLHTQIDSGNKEMRGLASDILKSDSETRTVVREGNTIMVGIKALLEAHILLHDKH